MPNLLADSSDDIVGLLIILGFTFGPLLIAYLLGKYIEISHLKDIAKRRVELSSIILSNTKRLSATGKYECLGLETASVVIGADHFKVFISKLKKLIGGRLGTYQKVLSRTRDEAILRLQAKAKAKGADLIINMRFETSTIGGGQSAQQRLYCFEVLAYGTLIKTLAETD